MSIVNDQQARLQALAERRRTALAEVEQIDKAARSIIEKQRAQLQEAEDVWQEWLDPTPEAPAAPLVGYDPLGPAAAADWRESHGIPADWTWTRSLPALDGHQFRRSDGLLINVDRNGQRTRLISDSPQG